MNRLDKELIELEKELINYVRKEIESSTSETLAKDISEVVRVIIELEKVIHPY